MGKNKTQTNKKQAPKDNWLTAGIFCIVFGFFMMLFSPGFGAFLVFAGAAITLWRTIRRMKAEKQAKLDEQKRITEETAKAEREKAKQEERKRKWEATHYRESYILEAKTATDKERDSYQKLLYKIREKLYKFDDDNPIEVSVIPTEESVTFYANGENIGHLSDDDKGDFLNNGDTVTHIDIDIINRMGYEAKVTCLFERDEEQ